MTPKHTRIELLTLGDELLLGLTANSHLTFVGAQLARRGLALARNVTVTDDAEVIARQFAESWAAADVVITSGGLGPTCDDRTREAVAGVLGQRLVFDEGAAAAIRERFARMRREMTENNLKQAMRPERGELLPNPNGTAPGIWVEQDGKVLCMLPGPPSELQPMFVAQVLPRLAARGLLAEGEAYVQVRTAGIGESLLETRLAPVLARHGDALSVAWCAHLGAVDCRLSSPDGRMGRMELEALARECAALLGDDFLCFGHDSLAKVTADLLRSGERMLAVAETATGGMLANCFAEVSGAGKFFAGGCVCYSNESKMQLLDIPEDILIQHGAVSGETAVAMATGAAERLGADYALSITGVRGDSSVPAGEAIFMGLYSPKGAWAKQLSFPGSREIAKQRAVNAALDWLRRELLRTRSASGLEAGAPSMRM
ncbi:CinA family nicotinamide mononucleotide deamidase-related protein [Termitidicoccus mucosus]|uniref:CinA-like protein n=1 Tax=Termitidicoccus mucosus TaxID=1184151 RepID=A0A178ICC1_9BACT|nr:damage-inducible protein CinA [Opitutaceae bacterium TSB47]